MPNPPARAGQDTHLRLPKSGLKSIDVDDGLRRDGGGRGAEEGCRNAMRATGLEWLGEETRTKKATERGFGCTE